MNDAEIIFKENSLSLDDFIRLKKQAFGGTCPRNTALRSLKGSAYVLHAEIDGEVIATARIISDGGFVNYLADMIVVPEYQGMGIGRLIMERIIAYVKSNIPKCGRSMIALSAAKSKEGFYEKFGFKPRPDEKFGAGMQLWLSCESE